MNHSPSSSRWVPALAIAALGIVSLGAATFGARTPVPAAQRPAADAPVDVVDAPAPRTAPKESCRTCALGAGKEWL